MLLISKNSILLKGYNYGFIGGCCGTTPEYIRKTVEKTKNLPFLLPEKKNKTVVSSYTHAVEIGKKPVLLATGNHDIRLRDFEEAKENSQTTVVMNKYENKK